MMKKTMALTKTCTHLLLLFASCMLLACAQQEATEPPKADPVDVLVVGGDQHHDFDQWFNKATVATLENGGAEASYTDVPSRILPALETLDVLYLTNNQAIPDQEVRDNIFYHLGAGKGVMVGHAAAWYSWTDWPAYNRDIVSGGARSHFDYGTIEVIVEAPDHPIMKGVPATFTLDDELYRFEKDPEGPPVQVLASGKNPETGDTYPVVWLVHHTNGRIVVNTLGHDASAHDHPAYQTILQNSALWAGRAIN